MLHTFKLFNYAQVLCLGVLIVSAVTVAIVNDVYQNGSSYGSVSMWLLFVAIAGIIVQAILVICLGLYHIETIKVQFLVSVATIIKARFLIFLLTVSWGRCFYKVTSYILLVIYFQESNSLQSHITLPQK